VSFLFISPHLKMICELCKKQYLLQQIWREIPVSLMVRKKEVQFKRSNPVTGSWPSEFLTKQIGMANIQYHLVGSGPGHLQTCCGKSL